MTNAQESRLDDSRILYTGINGYLFGQERKNSPLGAESWLDQEHCRLSSNVPSQRIGRTSHSSLSRTEERRRVGGCFKLGPFCLPTHCRTSHSSLSRTEEAAASGWLLQTRAFRSSLKPHTMRATRMLLRVRGKGKWKGKKGKGKGKTKWRPLYHVSSSTTTSSAPISSASTSAPSSSASASAITSATSSSPPAPVVIPTRITCTLLLAVQWAPSRNVDVQERYIHGLWPHPHVAIVDNSLGDPVDFGDDLEAVLLMVWPNLLGDGSLQSHYDFWMHEWMNHGRHSGLTLRVYFFTAVALFRQLPSFTDMGLHVDSLTSLIDVRRTVQSSIVGVDPEVNVRNDGQMVLYILELRFQVNRILVFINRSWPHYTVGNAFPQITLNDNDRVSLPSHPPV